MAEGVIAVDRDLRIIDDLLALYRIEREAAAEAIDLRPTDPAEVICAAIADCEPRAGDRRIRIESSCPPSLEARMNPRLIEQALVNLLDNAVKYSPDGATVTVEADRADSRVRICVRDHGCGIPGEHLERIFEPFYCVDKSRSRALGGTGLGLAIVQHIARVHGGQVTVQSRVGEGSTFCLVLPA
ncbi:MAG: hypothetical protein GXY85_01490 [Candidatus Brocadiaceae bacterium]|nr:hypothetical protein [Candidatus Brocadiaceae bacterium]